MGLHWEWHEGGNTSVFLTGGVWASVRAEGMGQFCVQRVLALVSVLTCSASQPEQNPTGNVSLAGREAIS